MDAPLLFGDAASIVPNFWPSLCVFDLGQAALPLLAYLGHLPDAMC
jgi:hypothetical protein